jgi:tetratricopeptide (TPR) repeat protein
MTYPAICDDSISDFSSCPPFEEVLDNMILESKEKLKQKNYLRVRNIHRTAYEEAILRYGTDRKDTETNGTIIEASSSIIQKLWDIDHALGESYLAQRDLENALKTFKNLEHNSGEFFLSLPFNLACVRALQENPEEMYIELRKVLKMNPEYVQIAKKDEDFKQYWNNPEFLKIMREAKLLSR